MTKEGIISCCFEKFRHKHPSENDPNIQFALSLMQQEGIKRGSKIKGEQRRVDKHR